MLLKREVQTGVDISSPHTVLTYTHSGDSTVIVLVRVALGNASNPIEGDGVYTLSAFIDDVPVAPTSSVSVPATATRAIMQSRQLVLDDGDTLTVKVTGKSADTSVDSIVTIDDVTPAQAMDLAGDGQIVVDHDYGEPDNLRYVTAAGAGISGATIRAYTASDYTAGNRGQDFIVATSQTGADGRWDQAMMLEPASYVFVFYKPGQYGPDVRQVTVTE